MSLEWSAYAPGVFDLLSAQRSAEARRHAFGVELGRQYLQALAAFARATGSPWALEQCCDDVGLCTAPTWPAAYWHAVYRARRTGTRQGVRRLNGGWLTFSTGEAVPQTGTHQA